MRFITTSYTAQISKLPEIGRYIVAQFDEEGVVVYQADRPAISKFAISQSLDLNSAEIHAGDY